MKSLKVLLGLFTGIAAGALIGILFAPEKGSKTRKQFLSKSEDYADVIKDKFDTLMDGIEDKYDKTKKRAEDFVSEGKDKYDKTKQQVEDFVSDGKVKVENARKDGKHITS
jgi:gas vesicle protein